MRFSPIPWSDEAETGLNEVLGGDKHIIKDQVENGIAELWSLNGDGYLITRIEEERGELVIMCFQGKNAKTMVQECMTAADKQGLKTIRFHTQRPALKRLLKGFAPKESETVFRIEL